MRLTLTHVEVSIPRGTLTAAFESELDRLLHDGFGWTGRTTVAQRAFGIEPVSAGGGTVKVKNEVVIEFRIVARTK